MPTKKKTHFKSYLAMLLGMFIILALITTPVLAADSKTKFKKRMLIYASFMSNRTLAAQADMAFWQYVEDKTGGAVKVDWRFDGSLNPSSEQQSSVIESGVADMGVWLAAYDPATFPLGGVFAPLFITDKPDFTGRAIKYIWDNFPAWEKEMKKNNLVILNGYATGPVQIAGTTKPIRTLNDIAGRKYRATAFLGEAWAGMGGVPVNVAGSEIYTSVATGTVEGVILAMEHLNVFKLDEHLKFVAGGSGFGIYSGVFMGMNLDTWNSLEPELQNIMREARDVGIAKHAELASKTDIEVYKKFKAKGIDMFKIDPAEAEMFKKKLLPPYWDKIKAKQNKVNPKFGEMMDLYVQLCQKWKGTSLYKDPFDQ